MFCGRSLKMFCFCLQRRPNILLMISVRAVIGIFLMLNWHAMLQDYMLEHLKWSNASPWRSLPSKMFTKCTCACCNFLLVIRTLVAELQSILGGPSASPSSLRPTDAHNPNPGLSHYSLITHGFGPRTIESSLSVLQTYLDDLIKVYEGKEPPSTRHQQQQHIPMHTQTTERPHHNSTNDYSITMKHETARSDHCCKC